MAVTRVFALCLLASVSGIGADTAASQTWLGKEAERKVELMDSRNASSSSRLFRSSAASGPAGNVTLSISRKSRSHRVMPRGL